MKKLLLSIFTCAVALSASADKMVFIMDGSQEFYTGDAKQTIVLCGQETTDFLPLSADFGQISFTNTLYKVGAFRAKKGSKITVTPVEGVTITKITGRQQIPGTNIANCGLIAGAVYDEKTQTQTLNGPINAATTVTVSADYECRLSWIEVEYSGTPTGVCPPIFESTFPVIPTNKTVKAVSATAGATYQYKIGKEGTWAAVPAEGFKVQEPAIYYVKAVKDGKESAESASTFVPIAADLKMATFTFNNWPDMVSDAAGKKFTKEDLAKDGSGGNMSIAIATDKDTTILKSGAATLKISKGTTNTKIFYSATLGNTTDLRYYSKSVTTFGVEEGNELVAAVVNGGELNNYSAWGTKTPSSFKNCECTMFPKSNKNWFLLMEKDESFEPATSMSFTAGQDASNANYTGYLAHVYIFYRELGAGVADVMVDENAPVEYYNLQGVRVAAPENGIFIRRQGNKVEKILVK